jgi:hypothetical protein
VEILHSFHPWVTPILLLNLRQENITTVYLAQVMRQDQPQFIKNVTGGPFRYCDVELDDGSMVNRKLHNLRLYETNIISIIEMYLGIFKF